MEDNVGMLMAEKDAFQNRVSPMRTTVVNTYTHIHACIHVTRESR